MNQVITSTYNTLKSGIKEGYKMYNYGTGCGYNYGGYTGGYGYGGYTPVAYPATPCNNGGNNFALILVLFILLVIIGCCCGFNGLGENNRGCGCGC